MPLGRTTRDIPPMFRLPLLSALWLAMTLASIGGCAPLIDDPELPIIEVSDKDTGATIDLAPRQPLRIRLAGNRSTGFQWLLIDLTGHVLETVGEAPTYTAAPNPSGLLGAGGTETWTFRPIRSGEAVIRFEYRRPWENGREAIQSAVYRVKVR
jgi:inhibitor of cysteine peptidase